MNEQHPESGRGSGKRGRPAVGKPEQVRLSEAEKALAIAIGDGVLAKGVRGALEMAESWLRDTGKRLLNESLAEKLRTDCDGNTLDDAAMRLRLSELLRMESAARQKQPKALRSLSKDDQATATELGDGDLVEGVRIALSAARFLGKETARKLNSHGSGHSS